MIVVETNTVRRDRGAVNAKSVRLRANNNLAIARNHALHKRSMLRATVLHRLVTNHRDD